MIKDNILVIGARGQIGSELLPELRRAYGAFRVVAADRLPADNGPLKAGPYEQLDVLDRRALGALVDRYDINQVYHLAACLSATGEKNPQQAWDLNMQGLLNVLDLAREKQLTRVFWPSSIAVFGPPDVGRGATSPDLGRGATLPDVGRGAASPGVGRGATLPGVGRGATLPGASLQTCAHNPSTVYGISKTAGEHWCRYYYEKYGVDTRSLRYPGLISYRTPPGGGTTDYAVDIFHHAAAAKPYTCYLRADTRLPMMYMPDAVRATLELMQAPLPYLSVRGAYNLAAMSFTPAELAAAITRHLPAFRIEYAPDWRQAIADSWPGRIDDSAARQDWKWSHEYERYEMTRDMLLHLGINYKTIDSPTMEPDRIR